MKKKGIFKIILAILVLIFIVSSCGGGKDDDAAPEEDSQSAEAATPTEKTLPSEAPKEDPEPVDTAPKQNSDSNAEENSSSEPSSNVNYSLDDLSDLIEIVLDQRFPNYNISSEDNTITVNIWMDGIAIELAAIQENGGDASNESWMALKEGIGAMSDSICEVIDAGGREDVYFSLNLLNDQNLDNTLLSMLDSVIIYDVLA
ncbi:hypothetical protein AALC17_05310 [Oscillospiraceae bacterium 38-13]